MSTLRALLVIGAMLAGAPPAVAQSPCFAIAAPGARLECHDRTAREPAARFWAPLVLQPMLSAVCTPSNPCISGPEGSAYYIAPSSHRNHRPLFERTKASRLVPSCPGAGCSKSRTPR